MILPDTQVIPFKKGDFFEVQCQYKNDAGVNTDFTALGITVASEVRRPDGRLVATLTVTLGPMGAFTLTSSTSSWPLGDLLWDIQYTLSGRNFSTQNIILRMYQGATA